MERRTQQFCIFLIRCLDDPVQESLNLFMGCVVRIVHIIRRKKPTTEQHVNHTPMPILHRHDGQHVDGRRRIFGGLVRRQMDESNRSLDFDGWRFAWDR